MTQPDSTSPVILLTYLYSGSKSGNPQRLG